MPNYTVQDSTTGKKITFEWNDPNPPTDADMEEIFSQAKEEITIQAAKEEPGFVSKTLSNIPESAYEYGKAIITPLMHPIQTVSGLGNMLKGIDVKLRRLEGQKIKSEEEEFEPYAEAAGQFIKQRYGGWENIKKTVSEDPVGFVSDLSALFMGGGSAISKMGPISKAGKIISETGKAIEPLSIAGKTVEQISKPIKSVVTGILGTTTGRGKAVIEEALKGTEEFKQAMKGKISGEEIVETAKGGIHAIKEQRGEHYRAELSKIQKMKNPPRMDLNQPVNKFMETAKEYGISPKLNDAGDIIGLDFERSTIRNNLPAKKDFENLFDTLQNSIKDKDFYSSPIGFDTLKRQIGDMYHETSQGRAAVQKVKNEVSGQLRQKVHGYEGMTKDYEKTSRLINEIERTLSLKDKGSIDTALRKLNTAIREDDNFRRGLIQEIEKNTGKDITALVAGHLMEPKWSGTLRTSAIDIGAIFGAIFAHNPIALALIPAASPRAVGTTLTLLSKGGRAMKKIEATKATSPQARQIMYQTGRNISLEE
jgi:hypothetical protein